MIQQVSKTQKILGYVLAGPFALIADAFYAMANTSKKLSHFIANAILDKE